MASDPRLSLHLLHRPLIIGLLLLAALIVSGCRSDQSAEVTEPTPLNALPPEWTVIQIERSGRIPFFNSSSSPWQPVNIDDDADSEFLLLYTYDNSENGKLDGPVGGVIFDNQTTSAFATGQPPLPLPIQPTGGYIPYRLLPSYISGQQGAFLGPPSRDVENSTPVTLFLVQRQNALLREPASDGQDAGSDSGGDGATSPLNGGDDANTVQNEYDELVLTDGDTVLTFVWWRDEFDGYGVTQVRGPAGFRNINGDKRLPEWSNKPEEITVLDALYPLYGALETAKRPEDIDYANPERANLCRVFRYNRVAANEQPSGIGGRTYQSDIRFDATNMGIQFCDPPPVHPFYPEGVIVKYLRATAGEDRQALLWAGLNKQDRNSILQKTHFNPDGDRIERIETRTNIDYPEAYRTTRSPFLVDTRRLMTQVCAEVQPIDGDGSGSRLLYFSLIHSRPNIAATDAITVPNESDGEHASDRLWIAYVDDASDWGAANCADLVAMDGE